MFNDKDYTEILALIAKERQARIRQRPQEIGECYFEDAVIVTSWMKGGLKEFMGGGKAPVHDPETPMVSRVSLPVIHINGDKAYAEVPATTIRYTYINGVKAVLTYFMRHMYKIVKRDGRWGIIDFRAIYESDMLVPEVPGQDLGIKPEDVAGFRHAYRFLSFIDKGTDQNMPGIDRPEMVREMYDSYENWLYS